MEAIVRRRSRNRPLRVTDKNNINNKKINLYFLIDFL
jgi:hypothetical protein